MRRAGVAVVLAATAALTGCSSNATGTTATPSSHATASHAPPVPRTGASASPEEPRDAPREAASPDPNFDYGFVVQITPSGFHPQWLVSGCCKPVTWRNLTGSPASVVFDHQLVDSGPIPPGGTFVFTPHNVQSIAYHSATSPSMIGVLQVNQTFES
jgi:hypothetical protein